MKLQEIEESEEDDMKTEMYGMEEETYTEEAHDGKMMEIDLEELLAELELEEEKVEELYPKQCV